MQSLGAEWAEAEAASCRRKNIQLAGTFRVCNRPGAGPPFPQPDCQTYNDTRMLRSKPAHGAARSPGIKAKGMKRSASVKPLLRRGRRGPGSTAGLLLLALGIAGCLAARRPALGQAQQESGDSQQPPFTLKENVHLVVVPVTVKDRQGSLIDNLTQDDFTVLEDGKARPIRYFSGETTPLSTVVLIDTGMSGVSVEAVRASLHNLDECFAPDDKEGLILFDNTLRTVADFSAPSTASAVFTQAENALPAGSGSGATVLGGPLGGPLNTLPVLNGVPGTAPSSAPRVAKRIDDALFAAVQQLHTQPPGRRRVIVILSDGVNGSDNQIHHDEVMEAMTATQVTVYAISFGSGWTSKHTDLLSRVAHETGGDIAYVQRKNGIERAFPEFTNEARNSYVLGFSPFATDGRIHDIQVRVRRRGVRTIARNRFLAIPNR